MPRQVRIEFEGAHYHVMCRGDRREPIFSDDCDRDLFLRTLGEGCDRTGWRIHAYVLMGNHYHMLLQTPEPNLVKGMTWFQTTYTVRYNARHKLNGHLFGGRYRAIIVEPEKGEYFSTLLDYIHLNPVRAGIVRTRDGRKRQRVAAYQWSSLPGYGARPRSRAAFLETADGFAAFDLRDGLRGRRDFIERLEARAQEEVAAKCGLSLIEGQSLQSTLRRGWCYGSELFKERMLAIADGALMKRRRSSRNNYHGEELRDHGKSRAEAIFKEGLKLFGLQEQALAALRKNALEKTVIAWKISRETSVPHAWIAGRLRMGNPANVSRAVRTVENPPATHHRDIQRAKRAIHARLSS